MQWELEVNRAIIEKVEAAETRLAEERAALHKDLENAIELERQMATEEAHKAIKEMEAEAEATQRAIKQRLAEKEEAVSEELISERQRCSVRRCRLMTSG